MAIMGGRAFLTWPGPAALEHCTNRLVCCDTWQPRMDPESRNRQPHARHEEATRTPPRQAGRTGPRRCAWKGGAANMQPYRQRLAVFDE